MTTFNPPQSPEAKQKLNATQRARWATRRMTVRSSASKRLSLINRKHKKTASNEKNATTGNPNEPHFEDPDNPEQNHEVVADDEDEDEDEDDDEHQGRRLFFNQPLPPDLVDEDGTPIQTFTRNKIRTAKYTPISFIPKNLWFQFHNVANIFFLFLVILVVS